MTTKKNDPNKELRKDVRNATRTRVENRDALRRKIKIAYDLQKLRMQTQGRLNSSHDGSEVQLCEADKAVLEARAKELEKLEKLSFKDVEDHLKTIPFYTQVLSDKGRYRGVGPAMAAVILSEVDIEVATTASKLWAYAGLAPVPCKRCKSCQGVVVEDNSGKLKHEARVWDGKSLKNCEWAGKLTHDSLYDSARSARPKKGEKLPYNSWFKSKMLGVLGDCLLRSNSPWREYYDNYKHRWVSAGKGRSDQHRHRAAIRYMIKMLLLDIWIEWRTFEGLEVRRPYQEEYLGHVHGKVA